MRAAPRPTASSQTTGAPSTSGRSCSRTSPSQHARAHGAGRHRPSHQEPNKHDVTVSAANPFTSQRTAWGWDTTVGASGLVGAKEEVAGYAGAGISYSFPIGKTHVAHDTMEAIRINFGIQKIMMDIMSISPLGLLRDAIALFRVHARPTRRRT